ncbi:MAG: zinc ribbon domain-containing protein [Verrucomicrobiae bacterium]|nr:zinc ribbon domain-containing protein [Verrucomicrobiae bacterium]MCX7722265.1 zinc ribbon domain-containing protein [Verrucomicrobiae bacterium]MDW7980456.1 zinc ribbon domain-containing protein [Verrucomicrobiales bacterium]
MPVYEYECTNCGKKFSQTERMSEHGKRKVRCPKCNSDKVVQRVSTFFAITSKKS